MSGLFGIGTFDLFTWVFKIPLALVLGIGASFLFFRQTLESRLRQRRSPGNVRQESWSWGVAIVGIVPCLLGAWDPGIFAIFFVAALVIAIFARAGVFTWAMLGVIALAGVAAFVLHLGYSASTDRGLRSAARSAAASRSSSGFSGSTNSVNPPATAPTTPADPLGPAPSQETPR